MRLKIVSIGPAYPLRGGIADFNETLTRWLKKNNHDASIISYSLQYPNFLFPGKTQFSDENVPNDINIYTILNSVSPISWFTTARNVKKLNPDIVVIHYWMPFFAPALGIIAKILKRANIKTIAICHNIVPHESKFYDKILNKFFVKHITGFVCLAKSVYKDLEQLKATPNKVFTPHPLYDIFGEPVSRAKALEKLKLSADCNYILFFGLVRKYKGLDLLLEALGTEKMMQRNVKLIVAGEFYDDPDLYYNIIKRLGIEKKVIIHNRFIANDMVKYYFSACDIVTQTYHTATQSGISQIAYSFNKPILTTNVGGLAEIVPHNKVGYVVEKNPAEIANSIVDFYENNRKYFFERNAEIEKEKYSWQTFVNVLMELYRKM